MAPPFPYEAGLVGIAAAGFCALFAISYRVTVSVAAAIVIIAIIVMPIVVAIQTFFLSIAFSSFDYGKLFLHISSVLSFIMRVYLLSIRVRYS